LVECEAEDLKDAGSKLRRSRIGCRKSRIGFKTSRAGCRKSRIGFKTSRIG
jgi:hypothetical protein